MSTLDQPTWFSVLLAWYRGQSEDTRQAFLRGLTDGGRATIGFWIGHPHLPLHEVAAHLEQDPLYVSRMVREACQMWGIEPVLPVSRKDTPLGTSRVLENQRRLIAAFASRVGAERWQGSIHETVKAYPDTYAVWADLTEAPHAP